MNVVFVIVVLALVSCNQPGKQKGTLLAPKTDSITALDTTSVVEATTNISPVVKAAAFDGTVINTGNVKVEDLLTYAKSLIGIPYKYGSIDPSVGFDCSGFITHVFNHFNIKVPRSSIDFTNVSTDVDLAEAKAGDLILFTGTDATIRDVGHMGIITENITGDIHFIHSTSGKANGVTITALNKQYLERYVKVIRVFKENDAK
jgi:cell wall-associated NlpC family hydrolase